MSSRNVESVTLYLLAAVTVAGAGVLAVRIVGRIFGAILAALASLPH